MGTKNFDNALDLITFSRISGGTALRKISYGSELVTNGTFDTDTDWTKGTGWSIAGGVASSDGTQPSSSLLSQTGSGFVSGKVYLFSFTISSVTGIGFRPEFGGDTSAGYFTGSGTFSRVFVAASTTPSISIRAATAGVTGSVDNISVKEVLFDQPDGTLTLFTHPANIPRIDYNADGTVKGLLIEEARTNLIVNEYNRTGSPAWSVGGSVTQAQDQPSITGEVSGAWSYNGTGNPSDSLARGLTSLTADVWHTQSVIVKKLSGSNWMMLDFRFPTTASGRILCWFNIGTGVKGSSSVTAGTATAQLLDHDVEDLGNGYFRVWMVVKSTTGTQSGCNIIVTTADGSTTPAAGVLSNEFWQLEAGQFPTSSIRTSGSTVTRAADVASIPVTDFGYNQKAGTVVVEFESAVSDSINSIVTLGIESWQSSNLTKAISTPGTTRHLRVFDSSGVEILAIDAGTTPVGQTVKQAFTIKRGGYSAVIDGGSVAESASTAEVPLFTLLGIKFPKLTVKSIQYYPRRLSNAQLQELTS